MQNWSNEQLCALAQEGDFIARNLLLENNQSFIHMTTRKLYREMALTDQLGIQYDDLFQEGSIGLLNAIDRFDSDKGTKFLTYAAPTIRNAMIDLIRAAFSQFEQRMTTDRDGYVFEEVRLNGMILSEERMPRIEAVANPFVISPEDIYIKKEMMQELYAALKRLTSREQAYLLYRYGFTDETEHSLLGTALHFHLSESRAKRTEEQSMDNLWLELPWWF